MKTILIIILLAFSSLALGMGNQALYYLNPGLNKDYFDKEIVPKFTKEFLHKRMKVYDKPDLQSKFIETAKRHNGFESNGLKSSYYVNYLFRKIANSKEEVPGAVVLNASYQIPAYGKEGDFFLVRYLGHPKWVHKSEFSDVIDVVSRIKNRKRFGVRGDIKLYTDPNTEKEFKGFSFRDYVNLNYKYTEFVGLKVLDVLVKNHKIWIKVRIGGKDRPCRYSVQDLKKPIVVWINPFLEDGRRNMPGCFENLYGY